MIDEDNIEHRIRAEVLAWAIPGPGPSGTLDCDELINNLVGSVKEIIRQRSGQSVD